MGYYTLLASQIVGDQGQVVAFEPSTHNLRALFANLTANGCRNATVLSLALADSGEIAKLWSAPEYNTGVCTLRGSEFAESQTNYTTTVTTRLDDLQALRGLWGRPGILKIDAEGVELAVIRGAEQTLRSNPGLMICCELSPQWYSTAELVASLGTHGFIGEYFDGEEWKPLTGGLPDRQCNAWFWHQSCPRPASTRQR
jgi:FkbM family methyltransferase